MPPRKETEEAIRLVEAARARLAGRLVIDMVVPDYYARYPKPCAGGWGRLAINVSPSGKALPCHAAETIPGLEFWNVRDQSLADIWRDTRPSTPFAARTGCASPAGPASGGRSTGAAAAARRWRSSATPRRPTRPARSRRTMRASRRWPQRRRKPAPARSAGGRTRRRRCRRARFAEISDRGYNCAPSTSFSTRSASFSTRSARVQRPDSSPNPTVNREISKPCARVWEKTRTRARKGPRARRGRSSVALGKVDHLSSIAPFPVFRNDLLPRGAG